MIKTGVIIISFIFIGIVALNIILYYPLQFVDEVKSSDQTARRLSESTTRATREKSPPNKPSILIDVSTDTTVKRDIYGGKGDKKHLGGFLAEGDNMGMSPNLWDFMMGILGVKSLLDVGCGKGFSTKYFLDHGADVLCVEGSHDGVMQSLLPPSK